MDGAERQVVVLVDLPDEHVRTARHRPAPADVAAVRADLDGSVGTPYLVLHERPAPERAGDVEACSPCRADEPGAVFRPGGRFAATTLRAGDTGADRLREAGEQVAAHARAAGLTLAGPPRERYLADGVQVAWPVEEPEAGG